MPCGGGDDNGRYERELENMLCQLLTALEKDGRYYEYVKEQGALDVFWSAHKLADQARRKRELAEERAEAIRQEALKKLTAEEVEALGYRIHF